MQQADEEAAALAEDEDEDDEGPVAFADGRSLKEPISLWATEKEEHAIELNESMIGKLSGDAEKEARIASKRAAAGAEEGAKKMRKL